MATSLRSLVLWRRQLYSKLIKLKRWAIIIFKLPGFCLTLPMMWQLTRCFREERAREGLLHGNRSSNVWLIPINSFLRCLEPFIDTHGILRVGGRIERGPFAFDQKHPTILPDYRLTELIIAEMHVNLTHSKPERTLAELRLLYWAIGAKRLVSRVTRRCIACVKPLVKPSTPEMVTLPAARL